MFLRRTQIQFTKRYVKVNFRRQFGQFYLLKIGKSGITSGARVRAGREYVLFAYGLSFLFRFKTNTHFCRETTRNVENMRFLVSFSTQI